MWMPYIVLALKIISIYKNCCRIVFKFNQLSTTATTGHARTAVNVSTASIITCACVKMATREPTAAKVNMIAVQ